MQFFILLCIIFNPFRVASHVFFSISCGDHAGFAGGYVVPPAPEDYVVFPPVPPVVTHIKPFGLAESR